MRKINLLVSTLGILALTSCQEEDFGYKSYEPTSANTEYSLRFANREDVNVNIATQTPGAPYYIYFENPIGADGLYNGATVYFMARTPIESKLSVPSHVKKLYVASPNREVRELPVADINISDNDYIVSTSTRVNTESTPYSLEQATNKYNSYNAEGVYCYADWSDSYKMANADVTQPLLNYVHTNFPSASGKSLITDENVAKNTDLVVPATDDADYTAVWITWLGMGVGDQACRVWFFVYPDSYQASDFSNNMDLLLWGRSTSIDQNKGKPNRIDPLFDSKEDAIGTAIFVGYIKEGYRIGFAYQCYEANGQQGKVRYSTPGLNQDVVGTGKKPAAGGMTVNSTVDDNNYNIVGLERETWRDNGNTITTDHDFNDALLLIETSLPVKPKEEIPLDPPTSVVTTKGYYVFEDLKGNASSNDNDFNDVVIYYEKMIYTTNNGQETTTNNIQTWCDFKVDLLANACKNTNSVGLYHKKNSGDPITTILFTGITGEKNMETAPAFDGSTMVIKEHISMDSPDDVLFPFLRSVATSKSYSYDPLNPSAYEGDSENPNRYNLYTTTHATKEFPYAIEIPFVSGSLFQWMKEGIKITESYEDCPSAGWYTKIKNTGNLVPRTSGSKY